MRYPDATVPFSRLTPHTIVTVRVRLTKRWKVRMWLAKQLFGLGVRVLGAKPDLDFESGTEQQK